MTVIFIGLCSCGLLASIWGQMSVLPCIDVVQQVNLSQSTQVKLLD